MNQSSAAPKILLVKLSSLGDVLHNLPIVWDIRARLPNAQIDWVAEEAYVNLLTPLLTRDGFQGINRIIPFGLRRWKKSLFSIQAWKEFFAFRKQLQQVRYDVIIETQGLLKSALVCALANKTPNAVVAGLANASEFSGYEPIARAFYSQCVQVPFRCHAIDRSRYVTSSALDWLLIDRSEKVQFYPADYLDSIDTKQTGDFQKPYVLFFHSTAREAKRWCNANWIQLGKSLTELGYQAVLPWGNLAEKQISRELAAQIPGSIVPNAFSIEQAFPVIANSSLVVGVDTGLTHLAAVLNKPTVEIYCDSPRWKTEGYWSDKIRNIGDIQKPPTVTEALEASLHLLNVAKN
ncbi:lipopolysaccharide heptosyltransferase I [Polynucleobacter sp. MWH-UH25E]|uniref:lipopolysaccharide heptosyltransferase I n=1 Tax=Polynucleobacter sp. MWH-UH25E TaxID=1855616 RepID=UPI001BFD99BD|nr:lipopolysaccharide heptosyltransferase I [Polynucleobacter sp. MWH-UH25E]QWD62300.1 lipopolysaccharide heptosyltransferase I [Polynucleobacter sp. MWH-UH25E]